MTARFVDRDMIMRYHWGLAIGHTYTNSNGRDNHTAMQDCQCQPPRNDPASLCEDDEADADNPNVTDEPDPDIINTEYSLEIHDDMDWDESNSEGGDSEIDEEIYSSADEMLVHLRCLLLNFTHRRVVLQILRRREKRCV
jgi:hypothetical protein